MGNSVEASWPAITRALSSPESRIGARLVGRTTRRLPPTEAGRALAERSRALLGTCDDVVWRCAVAVHELTLCVGAATREPWDTAR